jgi:hypothetical protein
MAQFISKPVTIEAVWFQPGMHVPDWLLEDFQSGRATTFFREGRAFLELETANGKVIANQGDWIIREPSGKGCYPCKPDVFEAKYGPAPEASAKPGPDRVHQHQASLGSVQTEFISTKRVSAQPEIRDNAHGMRIIYADGYVSWCPLGVFQRDYQPIDGMSFGHALFALQHGAAKVARAGWNGKGMWLQLVKAENVIVSVQGHEVNQTGVRAMPGEPLVQLFPWIGMKTADDKFGPWLASQTDMLANDWQVVL